MDYCSVIIINAEIVVFFTHAASKKINGKAPFWKIRAAYTKEIVGYRKVLSARSYNDGTVNVYQTFVIIAVMYQETLLSA